MPLDPLTARHIYDRIGSIVDAQRLYEDASTRRLAELADLQHCSSVFELGCGTGRFAAHLLSTMLPATATYRGVDVSPNMVALARKRLAPWSTRAEVLLVEPPAVELPAEDGSFDRFVSTYVFDLLFPGDAQALIGEAARVLAAGGLLALVSLTHGTTTVSRIVSSGWRAVSERWPRLVGGCRPIELGDLLTGPEWSVEHTEVVVGLGVPSEVVIARRKVDV